MPLCKPTRTRSHAVSHQESRLEGWLSHEIKRHRKWRRRWSFLYFGTAALTIISGAATTVAAGLLEPESAKRYTLWLAALTTVLASLEKVLRFREKWDLHRGIQVALEMTDLRRSAGLLKDEEAIDRLERIARSYDAKLAQLSSPVPDGGGDEDEEKA
jgi:hypothetical protein